MFAYGCLNLWRPGAPKRTCTSVTYHLCSIEHSTFRFIASAISSCAPRQRAFFGWHTTWQGSRPSACKHCEGISLIFGFLGASRIQKRKDGVCPTILQLLPRDHHHHTDLLAFLLYDTEEGDAFPGADHGRSCVSPLSSILISSILYDNYYVTL